MPGVTQTANERLANTGNRLINEFDTGPGARLEDTVIDAARPTLASVKESLADVDTSVNRSFDVAEGSQDRQISRLGHTLTTREKASLKRRRGLSRSLGSVDAKNREVAAIHQRSDIASMGVADLRSIIENNSLRAQVNTAGSETAREAKFVQDKAEHKARGLSSIGTLAGIGLTIATGGAAAPVLAAGALG